MTNNNDLTEYDAYIERLFALCAEVDVDMEELDCFEEMIAEHGALTDASIIAHNKWSLACTAHFVKVRDDKSHFHTECHFCMRRATPCPL